MAEYIKRESIDFIEMKSARFIDGELYVSIDEVYSEVKKFPTVEAEPVIHARWKESDFIPGMLTCSNCGAQRNPKFKIGGGKWNGCPNCRAKMDKED